MLTDDDLTTLAEKLVAQNVRIRLAFNEADDSTAPEPQAHYFLKIGDRRLGRDLKMYTFMAEVEGEPGTLTRIFQEVLLPLQQSAPSAYAEGWAWMKDKGDAFGEHQSAWEDLLNDDTFRPRF